MVEYWLQGGEKYAEVAGRTMYVYDILCIILFFLRFSGSNHRNDVDPGCVFS